MKEINGVDLKQCLALAEEQVQAELEASVVKKIRDQLMAAAQLKIKADNATIETTKLQGQLIQKENIIARIKNGDWSAVADSAKERDDNTKIEEGK